MDLIEILKRPEGKTLEFKRDLSSPAGLLRTAVAFANTTGGTLLVGVEDGTRRVLGVTDPLSLEERAASLLSDSITPRLLPDLDLLCYRRSHVLAVRIHPSSARPHFVAREGAERGTYVRVGSTNRRADPQLIAEMQRFARGEAYDEEPLPDLDSEALDFRVASELFAPVRRLTRRHLESLRLVTDYQGRMVPTVGGLLLFGRDRRSRFPDAWIQAGRFAGTDRAKILDQARIEEPLPAAIEAAVDFVEKHSLHGAAIGRVRRTDRWSLPPAAVREAIVNAVVHADYAQRGAPLRLAIFDDRLEVENPGLLPFGLTIEDLPRGISKLRNRVIGRVFHELGLVEMWGSGAQRMIAACQDSGLPAPRWEEVGTRLRVTLYTEPLAPPVQNDPDIAILEFLEDGGGHGTTEIAGVIGLTPRATRTRLRKLVERGSVREIGKGPRDPKRSYYLAGDGERT